MGGGLGHVGEGVPVFADGLQLLIEYGGVGGLLDHRQGTLEALVEVVQHLVHRRRPLLAVTHVIVQAGNAQVFGQCGEAGDEAELVAPADDAAHARPAVDGDQQGHQQDQAEADAQLAIYAHIAKVLG
ncbi:hypothetical protein D3C81_1788450 [compost metagenome]